MSDTAAFREAVSTLSVEDRPPSALATSFIDVLTVDAAAVSTLGDPFGVETLSAAGEGAAQLAEAQLDLGEGPIWLARRTRRSVLLHDVSESRSSWPAFASVLDEGGVNSVFAFPMVLGTLDVGVVSLYRTARLPFDSLDLEDAQILVHLVSRLVLKRALREVQADPDDDREVPFSRREVHQATGMVIAQLGVSAEDALLTIRAYSYAMGMSVREVCAAIVARTLDLSDSRASE